VYNLAADAVTVSGNTDIAFNSNGALSGVTHTAGATTVTVPNTGIYQIDYGVNIQAGFGSAVAIAVNGIPVPSTNIPVGVSGAAGTVILSLNAGDVLTLRNNTVNQIVLSPSPSIGALLRVIQLM
jgi:hypothetical protein